MLGTEINPPEKQNSCLTIKPFFQAQERLKFGLCFQNRVGKLHCAKYSEAYSITVEIGYLSHSSWEAEMSRQARNLNKTHPSKICPCDWLSHQVLKFNSPFTINLITISFFQTHPILWKFGPLNCLLITSAIVVILFDPHYNSWGISILYRWKKKSNI